MGYYTRYGLTVVDGEDNLIQEFREECVMANHAVDENGYTNDETKWYDHEKELKAFSKKHPSALFLLHGEGEEAGDLWDLYVKNGKSQTCKAEIVYPDFDESKLQ